MGHPARSITTNDQHKAIEDAILDGVDRVLAQRGFLAISVSNLATEIGISKATIRAYFPTDQDLILAHVDRIVADVIRQLRAIADSSGDPVSKIRRMLVERIIKRFDSIQHYTASLDEIFRGLRSVLLERREFYFEAEASVIAEVLREGARLGKFSSSDPLRIAETLVIATNAVLPFNLTDQEVRDRSAVRHRADQLADLLVNGLLKRCP